MENQLSKIIKELIKGVNVEGVKSIDWAKELQSMYELVEKTEKSKYGVPFLAEQDLIKIGRAHV